MLIIFLCLLGKMLEYKYPHFGGKCFDGALRILRLLISGGETGCYTGEYHFTSTNE
jgi:hypothetical protein